MSSATRCGCWSYLSRKTKKTSSKNRPCLPTGPRRSGARRASRHAGPRNTVSPILATNSRPAPANVTNSSASRHWNHRHCYTHGKLIWRRGKTPIQCPKFPLIVETIPSEIFKNSSLSKGSTFLRNEFSEFLMA